MFFFRQKRERKKKKQKKKKKKKKKNAKFTRIAANNGFEQSDRNDQNGEKHATARAEPIHGVRAQIGVGLAANRRRVSVDPSSVSIAGKEPEHAAADRLYFVEPTRDCVLRGAVVFRDLADGFDPAPFFTPVQSCLERMFKRQKAGLSFSRH